jgi:hypothetical protein
MTMEDLKKFCIDQKLVTKNNRINPRKIRDDSVQILEQKLNAPLKVAIDILFSKNGEKPTCSYCAGELDFYDLPNYKPIRYAHQECAVNARIEKIDWKAAVSKRKETCKNLYGSEHYFDYDSMITKSRKTKLEKYGTENFVNPEKAKQTKEELYGTSNYRNDAQIKETNLKRYGAENPFGSTKIIQKISGKLETNYGGRGFASEVLSKNIQQTVESVFGVSNAMKNPNVAKKSSSLKRKAYYGPTLFQTLTENLHEQYEKYVQQNQLSITKLATTLGIDRNTLSRAFKKDGFQILDRNYNCSTSTGERYLADLIRTIDPNVEIVLNTRSIIEPKELDLWLPKYQVGIEYHGSYWHQEERVGDLHREKAILAKEKNIRLIQIFDYELIEKTDKILSLLRSVMGLNSKKLYARDCNLVELDVHEARKFCDTYHLQAYAPAKINYGLVHKTEGLVQLMSFGRPRFTKRTEWEIIRLCTQFDTIVVGGTKKLWSKFIRDQNPVSVVTYADARFFTGNAYTNLGFTYEAHSGSGYLWTNGVSRLSRHQTRKRNLISEDTKSINNSEQQIMSGKGFYKLLDAGTYSYIWQSNGI